MGWSDESPHPRTSLQIVEELHTLLVQAQIPGPYVLVGHSFGGVNARLYASRYPDEVAGVVLVDSSHEDQLQRLPPLKKTLIEKMIFHRNLARFLAFTGVVRVFNNLSTDHEMFLGCIPKMYLALESTPKFMGTLFEEMGLFAKSLEQLKNGPHHLGEKPLIVITAGKTCSKGLLGQEYSDVWVEQMREAWNALQEELVTQSLDSKHVIAENSDHMITRHEPKIIIDAIHEMLDKLRNQKA
jgi:pimeloyl-ACP methyl ester carboxylesterase